MSDRPSVYKRHGQWWVQRPGYGFAPPEPCPYPTWRAAYASLVRGPGSAGPSVERTRTPAGVWKHNRRHDNWPVEVR